MHPRQIAAVVAALAVARALLAAATGDLDHGGGAVVLALLAVVLVVALALLREVVGTGVRALLLVAAMGCVLAAWGELSLVRASTVGDAQVAHDRMDSGGAVLSAGVAAAAVAGLVGRRVAVWWGLAAVALSVVVPPFVAPAAGLPALLLGLRQRDEA